MVRRLTEGTLHGWWRNDATRGAGWRSHYPRRVGPSTGLVDAAGIAVTCHLSSVPDPSGLRDVGGGRCDRWTRTPSPAGDQLGDAPAPSSDSRFACKTRSMNSAPHQPNSEAASGSHAPVIGW